MTVTPKSALRLVKPIVIYFFVWYTMIKLTRLDGTEYYINPHQIECIEVNPDTTLVMLSGKHHIVREEVDDVLGAIEEYHRRITPPVIQE